MRVLLAVLLAVLIPGAAGAHPGRLNADGCHHVRTRFVYKSGKVVEPGQYHCHQKLGRMILGPRNVIMDEDPEPAAPRPIPARPKPGGRR